MSFDILHKIERHFSFSYAARKAKAPRTNLGAFPLLSGVSVPDFFDADPDAQLTLPPLRLYC